jgi:flagellar motor switch protein FliM
VSRPLTDIELRLTSRVTAVAVAQLRDAWRDLVELDIAVRHVCSDPHAARIAAASDIVARIALDVSLPAARGAICLCLPAAALAPFAAGATTRGTIGRPLAAPGTIAAQGQGTPLELVVHLAETRVAAADMLNLRVGDIITTAHEVGRPLSVCIDGVPKFRARAGALEGRKAVQIEAPR